MKISGVHTLIQTVSINISLLFRIQNKD